MYDQLRDRAEWRSLLGDSEIRGVETFGDPVEIPARKRETIVDLGGDRVANLVVQTLPEHEVKIGDTLDGAKVIDVAKISDAIGNATLRTCYAKA